MIRGKNIGLPFKSPLDGFDLATHGHTSLNVKWAILFLWGGR